MLKRYIRRLAIRAGWYAIEQLIPKLEGQKLAPERFAPRSVVPDPDVAPTILDAQIVEILAGASNGLVFWQILVMVDATTLQVQQSLLKLQDQHGLVEVDHLRRYKLARA